MGLSALFLSLGLSGCSTPQPSEEKRALAFQNEIQRAFRTGELSTCELTAASEKAALDGDFIRMRHLKIVIPRSALFPSAEQTVEDVAAQQDLSFRRFVSLRNGEGYVLFEIAHKRQRLAAVLLVSGARATASPQPSQIPAEEAEPSKTVLPRYFHGDYRIAIIIDDLGADLKAAEALSKLPEQVTFSILPEQRFSRETAELAKVTGKEVMVHLPLEPEAREGLAVGPKTILTSMTSHEVESIFNEDVTSVPNAVGINNHMGSKVTSNRAIMMEILTLTKLHGMFFIDSRTTPETQAFAIARELGVPTNFRSVFLDDKPNVHYTEGQIDVLLGRMLRQGSAIAIGHPYPTTIQTLKKRLPELEHRGVKIVFASQLVS